MQHLKGQELQSSDVRPNLKQLALPGCNTRLFSAQAGCMVDSHPHERAEEVFLLAGRLRLNDAILEPGDMYRVEPGETHDAEALEDCRFLVMNYPQGA
jgi:quercetin dioxygenase-like cupin family protein